jgi:hypothetical protein
LLLHKTCLKLWQMTRPSAWVTRHTSTGCVNKQNFHYWSDANLQQLHECLLHSEHVTVLCCVGSFGVIGPYCFEEGRHDATINSGRYVHMLHNSSHQKLTDMELVNRPCAFNKTLLLQTPWQLCENVSWACHFSAWWSSMACSITWLEWCDNFLWGCLRAKVFINRRRTVLELKAMIEHEISAVPPNMVRRSVNKFKTRLQKCIWRDGKHLDGIIFKTKWAGSYTHKMAYFVMYYNK